MENKALNINEKDDAKKKKRKHKKIEISSDFVTSSYKTKATTECINEAARFDT